MTHYARKNVFGKLRTLCNIAYPFWWTKDKKGVTCPKCLEVLEKEKRLKSGTKG